jgi:PAS domain S-box-containing protein
LIGQFQPYRISTLLEPTWESCYRKNPVPDPPVEPLLAALVESSDDAIVSKDLEGRITSWNQAAERIFGYSAAEAIGQPITILAVPGHIDEMSTILDQIKRGQRIQHYETVRQTKDGRRVDISLTVSPIVDSQGRIVGASKIARDITGRKLIEADLQRKTERLARANAELLQFAYVVSHDLKEPLRAIQAFTELFLRQHEDPLPEGEREWLNEVVKAATRMNAMIAGLLTYSRQGDDASQFEPVDIRDVVEWAIANLPKDTAGSEAKIECDLASLPQVYGNKIALIQVVQNLLSNALKFRGDAPAHIRIAVERQDRYWIFAVTDNGLGIDPRYFDWIFTIFRRLHGSEYPGTGIGLAICKKIVENHGGKIWVESEVGHGATFFFSIPAEEPE